MPSTYPKTVAKSSTKAEKAGQKTATAQLAKRIVAPGKGSKAGGGGVKKATAATAKAKSLAATSTPTSSTSSANPNTTTTTTNTTKKVAARRLEISPEMEEVVRVIAREEIAKHWKRVRAGQAAPKAAGASKKASFKPAKVAAPKTKTEAPRIPFTNQIIEAVLAINPVTRQASRQDVKTHIKAHHPSMNPETIDKHVANALKAGGEHHLFLFPKGPSGRIMVPMASLNKKQVEVVQTAKQQKQQSKSSQ